MRNHDHTTVDAAAQAGRLVVMRIHAGEACEEAAQGQESGQGRETKSSGGHEYDADVLAPSLI
jgi:hypothetical protein